MLSHFIMYLPANQGDIAHTCIKNSAGRCPMSALEGHSKNGIQPRISHGYWESILMSHWKNVKQPPRNVNKHIAITTTGSNWCLSNVLLFVLLQHHQCRNTTRTRPWMRPTPPSLSCWSLLSPVEPLSGGWFLLPCFCSVPLSFLHRFHFLFSSDNGAVESECCLQGQLACWFCLLHFFL